MNKTAYCAIWWKTSKLAFLSWKLKEIRKKRIYKTVEYHRFIMKRYFVIINAKNRIVKTRIRIFVIFFIYTVTKLELKDIWLSFGQMLIQMFNTANCENLNISNKGILLWLIGLFFISVTSQITKSWKEKCTFYL